MVRERDHGPVRIGGAVSRRVVLAGGGGTALAALLACGPAAPGAGKGDQAGVPLEKRKPTSFEIWSTPDNLQRQSQIEAWNAKYAQIKVVLGQERTTGQGVDALAKLTAAIAAGTAPPVVDFDRFQVASYAHRKVFRPLDDFVKRDKYDLKKFVPAVLEEAMGFDKKLYGLPRSTDDRLVYWNKDHFQDIGQNPERGPTTWDELKQFAIRLTRRGGPAGLERLGLHTRVGQIHFHIFGWQNGGVFQSADGKKATLADAKNIDALDWMTTTTRDIAGWQLMETFRRTWPTGTGQDPFLQNNLSMIYQTNNFIGTIARFRPDMNYGFAAPPVRRPGDKPLTWSGGFSYVMTREAKDADLGWEFIKWLVSEEGWMAGWEGDAARAKSTGGVYVPGMTGQPDLDKKGYARFRTGIASIDKLPTFAVDLMQHTRFRELSLASAELWDGIKRSELEAISQEKAHRQALEDNNIMVQKALDEAWGAAPK